MKNMWGYFGVDIAFHIIPYDDAVFVWTWEKWGKAITFKRKEMYAETHQKIVHINAWKNENRITVFIRAKNLAS